VTRGAIRAKHSSQSRCALQFRGRHDLGFGLNRSASSETGLANTCPLERAPVVAGAALFAAQLQGANLGAAKLQGALLRKTRLQGADLRAARFQGAGLFGAGLQGADLSKADLGNSVLAAVSIWRARNAICTDARIADPLTNNVIESPGGIIPATRDAIVEFIERSIAEIPNASNKAKVADRMRKGLVIDSAKDDTETIAKVWITCEKAETSTMPQEKFDEHRAAVLRDLVCKEYKPRGLFPDTEAILAAERERENRKAIAAGHYSRLGFH
jgi:Pentapeptide repeats (8 copies)